MPPSTISPASIEVPAAVTVVVGPEDLLAERAVSLVQRAARSLDAQSDIRDIKAGDLTAPGLDEVLSPSLFGERRVLVVRGLGVGKADDESEGDDSEGGETSGGAGALDAAVLNRIVAHAASTDPDVHLVLVHREANRGRAALTTLKKSGARFVECKRIKGARGFTDFVAAEFRSHERPISADVPPAVVLAIGQDLRALAAAVSQICTDAAGAGRIERGDVERFFAGRVEADGFVIADAVIEGRTPAALGLARHALAVGTGGPALTAAMAYSFRSLVKASAAPRSGSLEEQAAAVGLREWQLRKARQQLSGWTPEGVGLAIRAIADADAEVKGAAVDADYAIERLIVRVGRARHAR
jgi:DNA polymerase-3 subunit delta